MEKNKYTDYNFEGDFKLLDDEELIGLATYNKNELNSKQFGYVAKILEKRGHDLNEFEDSTKTGGRNEIGKMIVPALFLFYGLFRFFSSGNYIFIILAIGWLLLIIFGSKKNE